MPVSAVVGAQWGDEGKGKLVDVFSQHTDWAVRYAGGANAGHTLVTNGRSMVLHLVPCGALHSGVRCLVGAGTVVDLEILCEEIRSLRSMGLMESPRVFVDERAHVVLPQHRMVDSLREEGPGAIGTTKRGIGPAYQDKAARRGIRVGDLMRDDLDRLIEEHLQAWAPEIEGAGETLPKVDEVLRLCQTAAEQLGSHIVNGMERIHGAMDANQRILLEGAQGAMLDLDHGTYPYVTSSTVTAGGACGGAGIAPTHIDRVVGISKAYTTRVGAGPFPTEMDEVESERLRDLGGEFGATTGRPRRCGWLDLVALRHARRINGFSSLALTKMDVLCGAGPVKVCVDYELHGERLNHVPSQGLERVRPVFETLDGWPTFVNARSLGDLPKEARAFVDRVEAYVGVPIRTLSVGADREATLGDLQLFDG